MAGRMGLRAFSLVVALLWGSCRALTVAEKASTKGLDQVITILLNLMTEFRSQASQDEKSWTDYQKWGQNTEVERQEYVRNQDALVLQNTAMVNAKQGDVQRFTSELSQLDASSRDTQKSLGTLIKMRHDEHTQHQAQLGDLTQTIDAVGRAIQILEGHYSANAATLAEIKKRVQFALTLTGAVNKKNALTGLMQRTPDWLTVDGASSYNSYGAQGGGQGVMGTLNELRSTLDSNRQTSIEQESSAVRDFESQKAMQQSTLARLSDEVTGKMAEKGDANAAIATGQATIAQAAQDSNDAQMTLQQLTADLATFKTEYERRTRTREDEISATQAALDALQSVSSEAKSGVSAGLLQFGKKRKVLQCVRCQQQAKKLMALSKSLHSDSLMQVAGELTQRAENSFDPSSMDPVKELLSTLIARLEAEASEESSHHDWCETEKSNSVTAKAQREQLIRTLQGDIERFTVAVQQLKTEVEFLQSEVTRVTKENGDATTNRNTAHSAFTTANSQHTEVINAISSALQALAKMSLLQGGEKGAAKKQLSVKSVNKAGHKESPFAAYAGGGGVDGSASNMLEDLLKRYNEARTNLQTDEQNSVAAFNALSAANSQFLTDTQSTVNARIAERRGKVMQLSNDKAEMTTNFKELKELAQYLQDLRPNCDDIRSTFEERKRRREAEISALRECVSVLSDPSALR